MPDTKIDANLYPVGIVSVMGAEVEGAERQVPEGEPPPLPVNSELKSIGKPTPRLDGELKVTGAVLRFLCNAPSTRSAELPSPSLMERGGGEALKRRRPA